MNLPASPAPIAIIGAGAIGLCLAHGLRELGPALICGGTPFEELRLSEREGEERLPVRRAQDPETELAEVRTAVLAVKAHHTAETAPWLAALRPGTRLIVAQNGVEHRERVEPLVAEGVEIVPAIVYLNVERTAPGRVIMRRVGDTDLALAAGPGADDLAVSLGEGGVRTTISSDFGTDAWSKLLTNITGNPITALTGRRAEVLRDPAIAQLARTIMDEAAVVARAEGASIDEAEVDRIQRWFQAVPTGATSSMLQDRLAGRELEYDALTGAVVRLAERHGIEVPVNRMVLALIAQISTAEG